MDVSDARARYLVALVGRYAEKDSGILEVGCREGDNLASLWRAGLTNLQGLEGNTEKASALKERHPDVVERVGVNAGPIDELLRGIEDASVDLVFTVGFLFDKSGDFNWLFPEISRVARRHLISIEDESSGSMRGVFEQLGLKEVEAADLSQKKELDSVFTVRVFEKSS
jgi:ubiquinone/menaquinone biosynthesis C-methylase UbiE